MINLTRTPTEPGCVRSYTVSRPSELHHRFTVSLLTTGKRSTRNAWLVTDHLTGAYVHTWNRREAVEQIARIAQPLPAGDDERFVIYPRTTTPVSQEPIVLIDRVTGRWWLRSEAEDLTSERAILEKLSHQ